LIAATMVSTSAAWLIRRLLSPIHFLAKLIGIVDALMLAASLAAAQANTTANVQPATDPIRVMVDRLDLNRYKETLRGLARFGDRRQGTARNRAAVDWIEAQLKSYGCTNTERITYKYTGEQIQNDPVSQPDTALRRINAEPATPGERQEVFCTKIGRTHPEEMYIVGGHMDGRGFGAAVDDDGSGTALVMELARLFSAPDVTTDRSIRFILWNNEETGLDGSRAYVAQRKALQGVESPSGSGKYPEPKWVGMIQHDMVLWDHGMPGPDGKVSAEQRREADVNIEFAGNSKFADKSQQMAWFFRRSNDRYATDYPAAVGDRMSNTDSDPFKDLTPTISLRENERLSQTGRGWNPTWHQPIDVFSTFSDKDFRLGLNAAQTTLSALAQLAEVTLK
jgi:hypothetical protein